MENTENELTETSVEELSLRDEAIKTFVLTAAATAGLWGTMLVGGYVYGKIQQRKERKQFEQDLHEHIN